LLETSAIVALDVRLVKGNGFGGVIQGVAEALRLEVGEAPVGEEDSGVGVVVDGSRVERDGFDVILFCIVVK